MARSTTVLLAVASQVTFARNCFPIMIATEEATVNDRPNVIFTDSASVLKAFEKGSIRNPYIQPIESLSKDRSIEFCWIPGHKGIAGNEGPSCE